MNPYIIIGLLVAWALSLAGVGAWQNEAGHVAERVEWQGRENKELVDANTAIKALEEKYRKAEQDHAADLSGIATNYEGKSKMRTINMLAMSLLCALALSACATQVPAANVPLAIQCPVLPPPPASVMVERPANFRASLLNFFSEKPAAPIPSLNSSQPASK